jgi:hypothetical protein
LNDTRRLLHDALGRYWSDADLTSCINSACKRVVADTTCNRQLQTIYLSTGLELYGYGMVSGCKVISGGTGYVNPTVAFSDPPSGGTTAVGVVVSSGGVITDVQVTHGGSGYTSAPTMTFTGGGSGANVVSSVPNISTLDVLNITVLWGQVRVILDTMSFTEFQSTVRSWVGYQQRPGLRAKYGQNQWYIGPLPDQPYTSEWDTNVIPPELVVPTDVSVLSYPYTDAVSYYAAHVAKFQEQSYTESEKFEQLYKQKALYALRAATLRTLPSAYGA